MNYLLDAHIWLWSIINKEKITANITELLINNSNKLFLSVISVWETLILVEKQKILINSKTEDWVEKALTLSGVELLDLNFEIVMESRKINLIHQDPADRFIAATAKYYKIPLITSDKKNY